MTKKCVKCFQNKDHKEFNKHKLTKDGFDSYCKKCKKDSDAELYQANISSERSKRRSYYKDNSAREKAKAKDKEEYKLNSEKIKVRVKKRQDSTPGLVKGSALKRNYWPQLTWQEALIKYDEMLKDQDCKCAICNKPETSRHQSGTINSLAVDHCYETGQIRKLLCSRCNRLLGVINDDVRILENAVNYLERFADVI